MTDPAAGIADHGGCKYRVLLALPSLVPLRTAVQALVIDVPQCAVQDRQLVHVFCADRHSLKSTHVKCTQ